MSEAIKQSLSAVMDGEGQDMDLQRVLKADASQCDPIEQMRRYQLIRSAIRDTDAVMLDVDLSASISAALHAEEIHAEEIDAEESVPSPGSEQASPRDWKPFGGFAVAAAVAAAVVFSVQFLQPQGAGDGSAAPLVASSAGSLGGQPFAVGVSDGASGQNTAARQSAEAARLRQRADQYMQIHARHASMNGAQGAIPLARAAQYNRR